MGGITNGILSNLISKFVTQLLDHLDEHDTKNSFKVVSTSLDDVNASDSIFGRVIEGFKDEVRRQSAVARRMHNEHMPINRLPPELLGDILAYALPGDEAYRNVNDRHKRLIALSNICMHWNAVIHSTPELWSFIKNSYTPEMLERYLVKSGSFPLTIQCLCKPRRGLNASENAVQEASLNFFFDHILGQSSRWGWASFVFLPPEYCIRLEQLSAQRLRLLDIECNPPSVSQYTNLLGGTAPRLRRLVTHGMVILGSSPILANLTSMTIGSIENLGEDAVENITKGLQSCLQLTYLRLFVVGVLEGVSPATFSSNPVVLPSLRTLDMSYNSLTFSKPFLDAVDTPELTSFHFCDHTKLRIDTVAEPSNPLHTVLQHVPEDYDLHLVLEGSRFTFKAEPTYVDDSYPVELELSCESITEGLECLNKLMDEDIIASPDHSDVTIKYGYALGDDFMEPLGRIPYVTAIEVQCSDLEAVGPLMVYLNRAPIPPATEWPLPHLNCLEFMANVDSSFLLWFLQIRYGGPDVRTAPEGEEPPDRLYTLRITDSDIRPSTIGELAVLLGPGVFHWRKDSDEEWNVEGERPQSTDGEEDSELSSESPAPSA